MAAVGLRHDHGPPVGEVPEPELAIAVARGEGGPGGVEGEGRHRRVVATQHEVGVGRSSLVRMRHPPRRSGET